MDKSFKPSDYLRNKRPELFADSACNNEFNIRKEELEFFLDTITARNETNKFEIFCRKLCQRIICPNLLPPTGPEGGGDSKADTETYAVSDEISERYFVGRANSGKENWAFTISAKAKWKDKIRSDVKGLLETGRKFERIFCISSRYIKSKELANLKAELLTLYSVPVDIFDKTWIVDQVLFEGCGDIAHYYLGVGERNERRVVGPNDYRRQQQLDIIEKEISEFTDKSASKIQLVEDAIVAAKLSRELELPRIQTEGRLERAIRFAEKYGTFKQRLDAYFQKLRTFCWWFDDIDVLNELFDSYAELAYKSDLAIDIVNIGAFLNVISISVHQGRLEKDSASLDTRFEKYRNILNIFASESSIRPNNAIEAQLQLCILDLSQAIKAKQIQQFKPIWNRLWKILDDSNGLIEFDPNVIADYLEVFGQAKQYDEEFDKLVEHCAEILGKREGEISEGKRLLKRAEQLSFDEPCELIRIAGKASIKLTKAEANSELIRALFLLGSAYRSIGLLWAARASYLYAISICFSEIVETNKIRIEIIPITKYWAWTCCELRKIPEFIEAYETLGILGALADLQDSSNETLQNDLTKLDCALASQIFHMSYEGAEALLNRTEVLEQAGLHTSRMALLFRTGHETFLREQGLIPSIEPHEETLDFFTKLANQPVNDELLTNEIFYFEQNKHCISTLIFGLEIKVQFPNEQWAITLAEVLVTSLEAFFATIHERQIIPHCEILIITISNDNQNSNLFEVNALDMTAIINWDKEKNLLNHTTYSSAVECLRDIIHHVAAYAFVGNLIQALEAIHEKDYFHHRLPLVASFHNSYHRVFNKFISSINDWPIDNHNQFIFLPEAPEIKIEPVIANFDSSESSELEEELEVSSSIETNKFSHRKASVMSLINVHAWDIAKWSGTAFIGQHGSGAPPFLIILFEDADAAASIFQAWRKRFGNFDSNDEIRITIVRYVDKNNPAHYKIIISSNIKNIKNKSGRRNLITSVKSNLMEPKSTFSLDTFLSNYREARSYLLMPGLLGPNESFTLRPDLGILKENLKVIALKDVRKNDLEAMAFPDKFSYS